jgi:GT2 family glycosyltransferase
MEHDATSALSQSDSAARPLVTVIVLSYNRPVLLERALASIVAQHYPRIELIVVDNPSVSSDDVSAMVRRYPSARLIAEEVNGGFTGGMNKGLWAATGTYVYFTEDDIELEPGCLEALVGHVERHPEVALAGPVMFNLHEGTVRCAGGRFELGSIYRMAIVGASPKEVIPSEPFTTSYLPGSTIFGRRTLLDSLGGFRKDFFMYTEDTELCARVLERQGVIAVVPAARVFHHEPLESAVAPLVSFHKYKNLAALYLLHAPLKVLPVFVARYGVVAFVRLLAKDAVLVPVFVRAWWWVGRNAPRLLAERVARRRGWSSGQATTHGAA